MIAVRLNARVFVLLAAFAFVGSGCKFLKKEEADAGSTATTDTAATAQADTPDAAAEEDAATAALASATATAAHGIPIPPPQDPDLAAADISRTNYKAELDKIEKTIDNEK